MNVTLKVDINIQMNCWSLTLLNTRDLIFFSTDQYPSKFNVQGDVDGQTNAYASINKFKRRYPRGAMKIKVQQVIFVLSFFFFLFELEWIPRVMSIM